MKSITIHKMDEHLSRELIRRAKSEELSINMMVKQLLAEALKIKVPKEPPHRSDFASFLGVWTEEDAREFAENTADMNSANPEDWS